MNWILLITLLLVFFQLKKYRQEILASNSYDLKRNLALVGVLSAVIAFFVLGFTTVKDNTYWIGFIDFNYYGLVAQGLVDSGIENIYGYLNSYSEGCLPLLSFYHFSDLWVVGVLYKLSGIPAAVIYKAVNLPFFVIVAVFGLFEYVTTRKNIIIAVGILFSGTLIYHVSRNNFIALSILSEPELKLLPPFVISFVALLIRKINLQLSLSTLWLAALFNILYLPFCILVSIRLLLINQGVKKYRLKLLPYLFIFLLYVIWLIFVSNITSDYNNTIPRSISLSLVLNKLVHYLWQFIFILPLLLFGFLVARTHLKWSFHSLVSLFGISVISYLIAASILYGHLQSFQLFMIARQLVILSLALLIAERNDPFNLFIKIGSSSYAIFIITVTISGTFMKWNRLENRDYIMLHNVKNEFHDVQTPPLIFKAKQGYLGEHKLSMLAIHPPFSYLAYLNSGSGALDLALPVYKNIENDFFFLESYKLQYNCFNLVDTSMLAWQESTLKFVRKYQIRSACVEADKLAIKVFNILKGNLVIEDSIVKPDSYRVYFWKKQI